MKNIYLIGMMGAGKTVTGEALADELNMKFIDLDEEIVKKVKMNINDIFETRGEPYFRRLEKESLNVAAKIRDRVIATGGGIVLDPDNVMLMKETGFVIYLQAPLEILWERIRNKADRPLLKVSNPQEVFAKLFLQRKRLYESIHDHAVNTQQKQPVQLAREIINLLGLSSHERT